MDHNDYGYSIHCYSRSSLTSGSSLENDLQLTCCVRGELNVVDLYSDDFSTQFIITTGSLKKSQIISFVFEAPAIICDEIKNKKNYEKKYLLGSYTTIKYVWEKKIGEQLF